MLLFGLARKAPVLRPVCRRTMFLLRTPMARVPGFSGVSAALRPHHVGGRPLPARPLLLRFSSSAGETGTAPKQPAAKSVSSTSTPKTAPLIPPKDTELPLLDSALLRDLALLTRYLRADWKLVAAALGCLVVSTAVLLLFPKWFGLIIDLLREIDPATFDALAPMLIMGRFSFAEFVGICVVACALFTGSVFGRVAILKLLGEKLIARLRLLTMKRLLTQDAEFFDKHKTGDIILRLLLDAHMVSRSITLQVADGFKNLLFLVFSTAMMFTIQPTLAWANLVLVPLTLWVLLVFGYRLKRASKELQAASGSLLKVTEEQLNAIKTVQLFAAEAGSLHQFNGEVQKVYNALKRETLLNTAYVAVCNLAYFVNYALVFLGGTYFVHRGAMTVGDLTGYFFYAEFACLLILQLTLFYGELMKGTGAAQRLLELMRARPSIRATAGIPVPPNIKGEITFENVTFAYPTRPDNLIFDNCSFTINAGDNVCVVGPLGRGKSTVTLLLLRFYDPQSGRILLDGEDISQYNVKLLRRTLGFVQQEPALLPGTIYENMTLGYRANHRPPLPVVRLVALRAHCQFIDDFPEGYDTVMASGGGRLSGGQKQRVAIARTLLKSPLVLILDEATLALDAHSEAVVNGEINRLLQVRGMTTVSIAHRLSTIRKAHTIIVLGYNGKVDEQGDFETLYANHNSALYRILHEHEVPGDKVVEDEAVVEAEAEKAPPGDKLDMAPQEQEPAAA